MLPKLRSGILDKRTVLFDYVNADNERTQREVEPLRLHFKYGSWYMYGFCRMRRAYREFRLSRMLDVQPTERTFSPHDNRPAEKTAEDPSTGPDAEEVSFRVSPSILSEAMDRFPQAAKQFDSDGSLTITLLVYRPLEARWLRSILLGFGAGVQVLKPIELRHLLREQFRQALDGYLDGYDED